MRDMVEMRVFIDKELNKAARIQAVKDEMSLAALVRIALKDYVDKRQRSSAGRKVR